MNWVRQLICWHDWDWTVEYLDKPHPTDDDRELAIQHKVCKNCGKDKRLWNCVTIKRSKYPEGIFQWVYDGMPEAYAEHKKRWKHEQPK